MYVLIKNGTRVVARAETAQGIRDIAVEMIAASPMSTFEAARVVKRVSTSYTPPSFSTVEEDV